MDAAVESRLDGREREEQRDSDELDSGQASRLQETCLQVCKDDPNFTASSIRSDRRLMNDPDRGSAAPEPRRFLPARLMRQIRKIKYLDCAATRILLAERTRRSRN